MLDFPLSTVPELASVQPRVTFHILETNEVQLNKVHLSRVLCGNCFSSLFSVGDRCVGRQIQLLLSGNTQRRRIRHEGTVSGVGVGGRVCVCLVLQ